MSQISPGTCRYCKCTDATPCSVPPYNEGDYCGWVASAMRTVCNAPSCLRAWARDQRVAQAEAAEEARRANRKHGDRYVGWGLGAITADMCKRSRAARRKGRAA